MISEDQEAIIILNWNGWQDTIECLESIRALEYVNYKIFVVDNNSNNDSVERIRSVFPDIDILVSKTNLGFSGGNNLAIRKAMTQGCNYFWLLNNDTTVNSLALSNMVRRMKADEDYGLIGSRIIEYYNPAKIQAWGGGKLNRFLITTRLIATEVDESTLDYLHGASILTSRKVLEDIGYLDESLFFYMEDLEFSIRVKEKYKLGVATDSIVYHKGGSSLKSEGKHKNFTIDEYYISSVARFMRIRRISLLIVVARYFLIVLNRIRRMEFDRILSLSKIYLKSYVK